MLIQSTQELKEFTKVNKNIDFDSIKESVALAELKYLMPVLDNPQYTDLSADLTANALDAAQTKLLIYCRRVIANAAMYLAYPFLNVQESDMGIQQNKSINGSNEPANQWRYQEARTSYLTLATQAVEELYRFLQANKTDYPLWVNGKGYSEYHYLFIRDNSELGQHLNTADSVRAYVALRPFIALAEVKYIKGIVGESNITALKTAQTGTPNTTQAAELTNIRNALAWAAFYEAIPVLSFELGTTSVTLSMQQDGINIKRPLSIEERKMMLQQARTNMEYFIEVLKTYYSTTTTEQTTHDLYCNEFKKDFWV